MFNLIKVTGESLSPALQEGDYVVITTIPFFFERIKRGDIVAFQHPYYGLLIKKVDHVNHESDEISVVGSHANSVDSKQFGFIRKSDLIGKVIWHIRKP